MGLAPVPKFEMGQATLSFTFPIVLLLEKKTARDRSIDLIARSLSIGDPWSPFLVGPPFLF